ncbi:hypothetical protein HK405_011204 [Cladochytrium tenue]|nr:hypothetical protein HK405_011204 [Cladochytrium tenue]
MKLYNAALVARQLIDVLALARHADAAAGALAWRGGGSGGGWAASAGGAAARGQPAAAAAVAAFYWTIDGPRVPWLALVAGIGSFLPNLFGCSERLLALDEANRALCVAPRIVVPLFITTIVMRAFLSVPMLLYTQRAMRRAIRRTELRLNTEAMAALAVVASGRPAHPPEGFAVVGRTY